uniref:Uncharacterized protein n=1 Tax=Neogobius melanostomus TaxID=47308 RepID=A0A8C6V3Z3_9GOBI
MYKRISVEPTPACSSSGLSSVCQWACPVPARQYAGQKRTHRQAGSELTHVIQSQVCSRPQLPAPLTPLRTCIYVYALVSSCGPPVVSEVCSRPSSRGLCLGWLNERGAVARDEIDERGVCITFATVFSHQYHFKQTAALIMSLHCLGHLCSSENLV